MNIALNKAVDLGDITVIPEVILYPIDHKEGIKHWGTMNLQELKAFVDEEVNYYSYKKEDL